MPIDRNYPKVDSVLSLTHARLNEVAEAHAHRQLVNASTPEGERVSAIDAVTSRPVTDPAKTARPRLALLPESKPVAAEHAPLLPAAVPKTPEIAPATPVPLPPAPAVKPRLATAKPEPIEPATHARLPARGAKEQEAHAPILPTHSAPKPVAEGATRSAPSTVRPDAEPVSVQVRQLPPAPAFDTSRIVWRDGPATRR